MIKIDTVMYYVDTHIGKYIDKYIDIICESVIMYKIMDVEHDVVQYVQRSMYYDDKYYCIVPCKKYDVVFDVKIQQLNANIPFMVGVEYELDKWRIYDKFTNIFINYLKPYTSILWVLRKSDVIIEDLRIVHPIKVSLKCHDYRMFNEDDVVCDDDNNMVYFDRYMVLLNDYVDDMCIILP